MAILAQDSFNRVDNATTLGNADTGQTYTYMNSSVWGISSNQAYCVSGVNPVGAVLDVGKSDVTVTVKMTKVSDTFSIFLRVDPVTKTGIAFQAATGSLQRFSGSTFTNIATSSTGVTGDTIKIIAQGSSLIVYRNGTQIISATSTVNQTLTKHGIGNWRSGGTVNGLWDDLLIEDLGTTPTGTTGSTLFDLKQSIYSSSSFNYDLKQALYQTLSQSFDSKQSIYQNGTSPFDSKQVLFNLSATQYDTKQTIYHVASMLYDTLQQIADGGIIGSTRFDTRMVLYSADKAVYDTKQSVYQTGANNYDLKQAIYQASQSNADIKLVIYADASSKFDSVQSLYADSFVKADTAQHYYTDGTIDFDTLQAILEDWAEYNEVIRIVLNITRKQTSVLDVAQKQTSTLEITQRMQNELKL